jgi:uncharacterized membrane protein YhaH (DUF805 family)
MFYLYNMIIVFASAFFVRPYAPDIDIAFRVVVLLPSFAVGARRMHDTNHSEWWILVPIVNFVFACIAGTPGANRFGADPKSSIPKGELPSKADSRRAEDDQGHEEGQL